MATIATSNPFMYLIFPPAGKAVAIPCVVELTQAGKDLEFRVEEDVYKGPEAAVFPLLREILFYTHVVHEPWSDSIDWQAAKAGRHERRATAVARKVRPPEGVRLGKTSVHCFLYTSKR